MYVFYSRQQHLFLWLGFFLSFKNKNLNNEIDLLNDEM